MKQPGERNKVISKVLAFSWQGIWVIACQLLVTAAKDQDCCAQIAGNGHLLFVNFYLSRDSAERLLRSAGKLIWPILPRVITAYCREVTRKQPEKEDTPIKISLENFLNLLYIYICLYTYRDLYIQICICTYVYTHTDGYVPCKINHKIILIIFHSNHWTFTKPQLAACWLSWPVVYSFTLGGNTLHKSSHNQIKGLIWKFSFGELKYRHFGISFMA